MYVVGSERVEHRRFPLQLISYLSSDLKVGNVFSNKLIYDVTRRVSTSIYDVNRFKSINI